MNLGNRLKKERERRNWSQRYVAEKVGITNTVLSNYERNYRDPDTETLAKLIKLYDVSADYILVGNRESCDNDEKSKKDLEKDEQRILNELKKYPDLFYELLTNPEQKVKDIVHSQKLRELIEKEITEDNKNNKY